MSEAVEKIRKCIVDLDMKSISGLVQEALGDGMSPQGVLQGMSQGMDIVGEKFSSYEYFLPELIAAGEIMETGMKVLAPLLKAGEVKNTGKVVIGTVRGDMHDIGKDIFGMLLIGAGFEVFDLGVDVEAKHFIEKLKETGAPILGMSAMLTVTMPEAGRVVEELKKAGIRDKVKVMFGGAAVTKDFGKEVGVDYAAKEAAEGVRVAVQWMKEG